MMETTAEELAAWKRVSVGYFGPEGVDLAIMDKAIQDEQAEMRMLQRDIDALTQRLAEAEGLLRELVDETGSGVRTRATAFLTGQQDSTERGGGV